MNEKNRILKKDTPRHLWNEFHMERPIYIMLGPQNYGHLILERNVDPMTGKNKVYVFHEGEVVMEIGILEASGKTIKQSYSAPENYRIIREEVLNRRERKAVLEWKVQNGN